MTTVNDIRTQLNEKFTKRQNAIDAEIRALEEKKRYCSEAVQAFSELLPNLEKPLSKLHLELIGVKVNYGELDSDGEFIGKLEVRTVQGFRYLTPGRNTNRDYTKLSSKAERMSESLLTTLKPYGVSYVCINPYSLQGGVGGSQVGDTLDIRIVIKK